MTIPDQYIQYLNRKQSKDVDVVKFGWKDLDEHLAYGGMQKDFLCYIFGDPGTYKTYFAVNFVPKVLKQGKRILFFSFEMSFDNIMDRLLQVILKKHISELREFVPENEKFVIDTLIGLHFFDRLKLVTDAKYLSEIENEIVSFQPDVVIIDYLQIIKSKISGGGEQNDYMKIKMFTMALQEIKKKYQIRIVCLVQLKRRSEEDRHSRLPRKDDARGSSDIECSADLIIGGYRPDSELEKCSQMDRGIIKLSTTLKNRYASIINPFMIKLKYNRVTGELTQDDNF